MHTNQPILNPSTFGSILVLTLFTTACSTPEHRIQRPVRTAQLVQASTATPPRPPKIAVPVDELHFHDPADLFIDAKLPLNLKPKPMAQPRKFRCPWVPPSVHTPKRPPIKMLAVASPSERRCGISG